VSIVERRQDDHSAIEGLLQRWSFSDRRNVTANLAVLVVSRVSVRLVQAYHV